MFCLLYTSLQYRMDLGLRNDPPPDSPIVRLGLAIVFLACLVFFARLCAHQYLFEESSVVRSFNMSYPADSRGFHKADDTSLF